MKSRTVGRVRGGFTLVEILVCIAIVGVLMALILPAVSAARHASRRTACLNNIRQVGAAFQLFHDANGRFPNSGTYAVNGDDLDCDGAPDMPNPQPAHFSTFWLLWAPWARPTFQDLRPLHGWAIDVLPFLDRSDVVDLWDRGRPFYDDKCSRNRQLSDTSLPIFVCPSDDSLVSGRGNLSYVVNGGYEGGWDRPIDWNGNGVTKDYLGSGPLSEDSRDQNQSRMLGLMALGNRNLMSAFDFKHRMSTVRDGAATTIMIAENVRTGYDPNSTSGIVHTWASPSPNHVAFYLSKRVCAGGCSANAAPNWSSANEAGQEGAINAALAKDEGAAPWPSSGHAGGVHVVFCDGHARFLSERIDGTVYAQLVSPAGAYLPYLAHRQTPASEDGY